MYLDGWGVHTPPPQRLNKSINKSTKKPGTGTGIQIFRALNEFSVFEIYFYIP